MQKLKRALMALKDWSKGHQGVSCLVGMALAIVASCTVDWAELDQKRASIDKLCAEARTQRLRDICDEAGWKKPISLWPEVTE